MGTAQEIAPDIAVLLAQTWQTRPGESIARDTICRIWAFDLGWFDMETAIRIRDNLIHTDWLDESSEGILPGIELDSVEIPFGWLPTMRLLNDPPKLPKSVVDKSVIEGDPEPETEVEVETAGIDPAATHISVLLEQISAASELDRKEVMRRAQRKRRALGPVTLWMSLLLVAREQQLAMHPLVKTISA